MLRGFPCTRTIVLTNPQLKNFAVMTNIIHCGVHPGGRLSVGGRFFEKLAGTVAHRGHVRSICYPVDTGYLAILNLVRK